MPATPNMRVEVVHLGGSRADAGCPRETLELQPGATLASVAALVGERHPRLREKLATVRWARNFELAPLGAEIADGDELALLPPVCGGAPRTELTNEVIDPL